MSDILALPADERPDDGLPRSIEALCRVVQGLLVHDAACASLYGPPPADLAVDRTTRPVAERLAIARGRHPGLPLTEPRLPFERQVGTCRDFAAMLCVLARMRGFEARVRCGFADYLGGGLDRPWQDHWVCEYRAAHGFGPVNGEGSGWALADAQMDAEHRAHLGLHLDPADVPRERFLTADRAWALCRSGAAEAAAFGHGATRGEGFVLVNLVRDALARRDVLTSSWDRWRDFGDLGAELDEAKREAGDAVAGGGAPDALGSGTCLRGAPVAD